MQFVIDCSAGTPDDLLPGKVKAIAREYGIFKKPSSDAEPEYITADHLFFAIDISTLEDLVAVAAQLDHPLIVSSPDRIGTALNPEGWPEYKDDLPKIEIYNDYRE
jgi:hypothetical protein